MKGWKQKQRERQLEAQARRQEQDVKDQFAQFMEGWQTAYDTLPLALKHAIAIDDINTLDPLQQEIVKTATHEAGHAVFDAPYVDYVSIQPVLTCNKRMPLDDGRFALPISAGRSKSLRFVGEQMETLPIGLIGEYIFSGAGAEHLLIGGLGQETTGLGASGDLYALRQACEKRHIPRDEQMRLVYQSGVNVERFVKMNTRRIYVVSTALINYKAVSGDDVRKIVQEVGEDLEFSAA